MTGYRVEKQNYSAGAWRVLHADTGEQVWRNTTMDHPHLGMIAFSGPVCFERKRDALAWIEAERVKRTAESEQYRANARECDRIALAGGPRQYLGRYAHEWDRLAVMARNLADGNPTLAGTDRA